MKNPNKIRLSREDIVYQIVVFSIVTIIVLSCIIPFIYVVGMSLTSEGEMIEKNFFVLFPSQPTLSAYNYIFAQNNFLSGMRISILRTTIGIFTALAFSVPAGFTLAKPDIPFRRSMMLFFIITMIISGGLIPSYLLMTKLKLINTFWVYIAPSFANTFGMLVIKLFVEQIPNDIIESAELDGASELQKLFLIAMPLLVPTLCALGLFAAVAHWNSWFDAMLYIRDSSLYPIQYIIRNLLVDIQTVDLMQNISTYQKMTPESLKMASVVIAMLPILCVYPFLQKYFIYGIYTGSIKG